MSVSLSENNSVAMAMFDSYSKTVMRNLSRDEIAKINKQTYHEIGGTEVMKYVTEASTIIIPCLDGILIMYVWKRTRRKTSSCPRNTALSELTALLHQ